MVIERDIFISPEVYEPHFVVGSESLETGKLERESVEGTQSRCEIGRIASPDNHGPVGDNYFAFDGVGTARDAQAAALAATKMQEAVEHHIEQVGGNLDHLSVEDMRSFLLRVVNRVQRGLKEMNKGKSLDQSYLTTMVLAAIHGENCFVVSVGDSPALLRKEDGGMEQVTVSHDSVRDHFERTKGFPKVIDEVDGGLDADKLSALRDAQAHMSPLLKNRITHMLGEDGPDIGFPFDVRMVKLQKGERLLLCSDGIPKELDDETMSRVLDPKFDLKRSTSKMMFESQRNDGDGEYHDDRVGMVIERT